MLKVLVAVWDVLTQNLWQSCFCCRSPQDQWHRGQCLGVPPSQHEEGETGLSPAQFWVQDVRGRVTPMSDIP